MQPTADLNMATYYLHRGWRTPNVLVTDHVSADRIIEANSLREALAAALADGSFLTADDANLVWLIDETGKLVWSLRLDDENVELEP